MRNQWPRKSEIMRNQWPSVGLSSHGLGPATFGTQQGTFWLRIFGPQNR